MTDIATLRDSALAYAARGWHIVPLHTPTPGGSCSCGSASCDNVGKHPRWHRTLLPSGVLSAAADAATIAAWWTMWPDANIGLATGAASGVWAIDVDPRHGGDLSLESLILAHEALPDTPTAQTGGGGQHLLFAHPGAPVGNKVRIAPGLDVRGDGGYIVVAPSLHESGRCYAWQLSPDDVPLADAPAWLLDLLAAPVQPAAAPPIARNGHGALPAKTMNYLFFGSANGTRNAALYAAAQQFKAAGYSEQEAAGHLRPRAQCDGLPDAEITKTIDSVYQHSRVSGQAAAPGSGPGATPASTSAPQPTPAGATSPAAASAPLRQSARIMQMLGQLGYAFQLNLCTDMIEVNGSPITDIVAARIRTDCRDAGIRPLAGVEDAYTAAAEGNAYHPIQDYLRGLSWDGTYRIAQLASKMTCIDPPVVAPDGTQHSLLHIYLWRWMIGVIARTLDQRQNLMLVLVGPQRCGKSTLAEWLCPLPDYFIRKGIDVGDKDTLIRMIGKWIWEVAELDATTRKADQSALKDLITMSSITVRRAYGRYDIQRPALASFIGTLNPSIGFLTDDTGNRRFMVTQIAAIDWSYQQIDRDQLWAEAVAAYQAGESWQPLPHEAAAQAEANKLHETGSLWDGWIVRYFDTDAGPADRMTASDIVDHLRQYHDIRSGGSPRAQEMEIARVLARLGVVKHRTPTWRGYVGIRPK